MMCHDHRDFVMHAMCGTCHLFPYTFFCTMCMHASAPSSCRVPVRWHVSFCSELEALLMGQSFCMAARLTVFF